jgi:hypothetical protein
MKRITGHPEVRTVLLGHTHYNSLEVLQTGDELLPGKFPVDDTSAQMLASLEIENPMRGYAVQQGHTRALGQFLPRAEYDARSVPLAPIANRVKAFGKMYDRLAPPREQRVLDAPMGLPRELVVLRLVSNADLSSQTYDSGKSALGFAVLHIAKKNDVRAYDKPQINGITFYVNTGSNTFQNLRTVSVDRNTHLAPHDASNPLQQIYSW